MPDFDEDGTIGFADFLLSVAQFGFSRGDKEYDARYDLDGMARLGLMIFYHGTGRIITQMANIRRVTC